MRTLIRQTTVVNAYVLDLWDGEFCLFEPSSWAARNSLVRLRRLSAAANPEMHYNPWRTTRHRHALASDYDYSGSCCDVLGDCEATAAPDFSSAWVLNPAKSTLPKGSPVKSRTIVRVSPGLAKCSDSGPGLRCINSAAKARRLHHEELRHSIRSRDADDAGRGRGFDIRGT